MLHFLVVDNVRRSVSDNEACDLAITAVHIAECWIFLVADYSFETKTTSTSSGFKLIKHFFIENIRLVNANVFSYLCVSMKICSMG